MLDVCLLGTGGMMPLPNRRLTAFQVRCQGKTILIDCGEGTQIPIRVSGWGFVNIEAICLTHFHADHVVGLPGLLLTMGNSGRLKPIVIAGPIGVQKIVKSLCIVAEGLPFEVRFFELSEEHSESFRVGDMVVTSLPVEHTDPCLSYRVDVLRKGKFNAVKARALGVPVEQWSALQNGENVWIGETLIRPEEVLGEARKGLRVTYATDTRPVSELIDFAQDSDLFVCEGMYGEDQFFDKATQNKHMLFSEAAQIASQAQVEEMWLTHFSPIVTAPDDYIEETQKIFQNSKVGKELMKKTFHFME